MTEVTLIGEHLAEEGLEFSFGGCLSKCKSCEIKNSCCGLEKDRWYRIVGVRDKKHDCKVHHGDVKVVEVKKIPVKTAVSGRTVIEGSVVTFEKKDCKEFECENFRLCHPTGIENKQKYDVKGVNKKIDCKKGYDLKEVELI
ncbi:MAG: UPF0179 family protein [Candidatus Saliniplasma sp.]